MMMKPIMEDPIDTTKENSPFLSVFSADPWFWMLKYFNKIPQLKYLMWIITIIGFSFEC